MAWFRNLCLSPLPAALIGAAAGLLVGLAITVSMVQHAVFTGKHQDVTAGVAVTALWVVIGLIAGLTVLSPSDAEGPPGGG